jgi:PAS domain S-box-containing protein
MSPPLPTPDALAADLARYRTMVEHAAEGICVGQGGRIRFANACCLDLLGVTAQEVAARAMIEYVHPDDREFVTSQRDRRSRGEHVPAFEARFVRPDGTVWWAEIAGVVAEWEGAPANLFYLRDTTGRRLLDEQLKATLARERELGELKSRLVALASHEFRTPLAAAMTTVLIVEDDDAIRSNITRLLKLEGFEIVSAINGREGLERMRQTSAGSGGF